MLCATDLSTLNDILPSLEHRLKMYEGGTTVNIIGSIDTNHKVKDKCHEEDHFPLALYGRKITAWEH